MFTFYGICENLWGGSPTVTSLPNAIDSPLQDQLSSTTFVNKFPDDLPPVKPASFKDEEEEFEESVETSTSSEEVTKWREKVSEMLKNRKKKKMTSQISTDNQFLQLTQEDIAFKKQMLETMEKCDTELRTELSNLNQVMSNISSSIQLSVGILGQLQSNQSRVFSPPAPFPHARSFLQNVYARDFLPNVQPTSTSTLAELQPSSQESDNVNEDQSQKNYYNFN